MALVDVVRAGLKVADSITGNGGLQETIQHRAKTGIDKSGNALLEATATARLAIVEKKVRRLISARGATMGKEVLSTHMLFFPRPVVITEFDEIVLADGSNRPILRVEGLDDGLLGQGYYAQVWLG